MDVTGLEYLLALEEEKGLTRAAEKLSISPSALSQRLAGQERELGFPLFQKGNGGFLPTEQGAVYLKYAREMVRVREETYRQIEKLARRRPTLRIISSYQVFPLLSDLVVPKLKEEFPGSRLDVQPSDSYIAKQYLLNDLADMGLLCQASAGSSLLEETVLGEDRLTAAFSRSLLPPGFSPACLEDCRDLPFILLRPGSSFRPMEDELLAARRLYPGTVCEAENFLAARDFLLAGCGVALLPASMVRREDDCVTLPLSPAPSYLRILAWPKYRPLGPEAERAKELIRQLLT